MQHPQQRHAKCRNRKMDSENGILRALASSHVSGSAVHNNRNSAMKELSKGGINTKTAAARDNEVTATAPGFRVKAAEAIHRVNADGLCAVPRCGYGTKEKEEADVVAELSGAGNPSGSASSVTLLSQHDRENWERKHKELPAVQRMKSQHEEQKNGLIGSSTRPSLARVMPTEGSQADSLACSEGSIDRREETSAQPNERMTIANRINGGDDSVSSDCSLSSIQVDLEIILSLQSRRLLEAEEAAAASPVTTLQMSAPVAPPSLALPGQQQSEMEKSAQHVEQSPGPRPRPSFPVSREEDEADGSRRRCSNPVERSPISEHGVREGVAAPLPWSRSFSPVWRNRGNPHEQNAHLPGGYDGVAAILGQRHLADTPTPQHVRTKTLNKGDDDPHRPATGGAADKQARAHNPAATQLHAQDHCNKDDDEEDRFLAQLRHQQRQHYEVLRREARRHPDRVCEDERVLLQLSASADQQQLPSRLAGTMSRFYAATAASGKEHKKNERREGKRQAFKKEDQKGRMSGATTAGGAGAVGDRRDIRHRSPPLGPMRQHQRFLLKQEHKQQGRDGAPARAYGSESFLSLTDIDEATDKTHLLPFAECPHVHPQRGSPGSRAAHRNRFEAVVDDEVVAMLGDGVPTRVGEGHSPVQHPRTLGEVVDGAATHKGLVSSPRQSLGGGIAAPAMHPQWAGREPKSPSPVEPFADVLNADNIRSAGSVQQLSSAQVGLMSAGLSTPSATGERLQGGQLLPPFYRSTSASSPSAQLQWRWYNTTLTPMRSVDNESAPWREKNSSLRHHQHGCSQASPPKGGEHRHHHSPMGHHSRIHALAAPSSSLAPELGTMPPGSVRAQSRCQARGGYQGAITHCHHPAKTARQTCNTPRRCSAQAKPSRHLATDQPRPQRTKTQAIAAAPNANGGGGDRRHRVVAVDTTPAARNIKPPLKRGRIMKQAQRTGALWRSIRSICASPSPELLPLSSGHPQFSVQRSPRRDQQDTKALNSHTHSSRAQDDGEAAHSGHSQADGLQAVGHSPEGLNTSTDWHGESRMDGGEANPLVQALKSSTGRRKRRDVDSHDEWLERLLPPYAAHSLVGNALVDFWGDVYMRRNKEKHI